jgi:protein TonB
MPPMKKTLFSLLAAALLMAGCAAPAPATGTADADDWKPNPPNPAPVYPAESRARMEQGRILVRVLTAPDGKPIRTEVKESSGFARLDKAAQDTVMQWRFKPRPQDTEAVWREVPISFLFSPTTGARTPTL